MSFQIKYVYDLVDQISPKLKAIQGNLQATANAVSSSASSMAASFNNVGNSIKNTGNNLRNAAGTLAPMSVAMGAIGVKALASSANFETLGIQLEVLTGSAEKGKNLFQELSQYAAQTPFQLPEIVQATRTLLGSNIALSDSVETIKMLGNVSAGSGADLKQLSVVFGQVAGMTKLQGQDAMQFISNGVPIWALLEKSTGKTIKTLRDMGSKGEIYFKMVEEALRKATLQGGMYYQATDKLSQSLSGLYSTLKDNVNIAFAELGNEMVKAADIKQLTKDIAEFAGKVTTAFKGLSPETKKFITYAVLIGTALAPVVFSIGSLLAVVGLAAAGFGALAAIFAFFFTPFGLWIVALGLFGLLFLRLKDDMVVVYDFIKNKLVAVFDYLASKIQAALKLLKEFKNGLKSVMKDGVEKTINQAPPINQSRPINQSQPVTAGGQLDVFFRNAPKGLVTNFTPAPSNFMNVGVNSVFAGT